MLNVRLLVGRFFLPHCEHVIPLSLAFVVSDEKAAVNPPKLPLQAMSRFSLAAFKFFFFFGCRHLNYDVSGCRSLCGYYAWIC